MTTTPKAGFGCKAKPETGEVQIFITGDRKPIPPGINVPADHIGPIVAMLMAAAVEASKGEIATAALLKNVLHVRNIHFAISRTQDGELSLTLHAGLAHFSIVLEPHAAVELGQKLLTVAGGEGRA